MGESGSTKKVATVGLVSILLVAAVVAVTVSVTENANRSISSSSKAVEAACAPTDYKEACKKSLSNTNATDPRGLFRASLDYTIDHLSHVIKDSSLIKSAAKDESTKDALNICEIVLERAVDDLKRSCDRAGTHESSTGIIDDIKTWLSAVVTYQETCIDAFENTTGDAGDKMKHLLRTSKELSSNGLAMVANIESIFSTLETGNFSSSRKLFSEERRQLLFKAKPNVVVALDGTGQFKSINAAIKNVPKGNTKPFIIKIKAGLYRENVEIPKLKHNIILIGDGPARTRITGNKNYANGVKTFHSATVAVNADDFMAKDLAIENTAGPQGHQAVALRVSGDRAIFHNVNMDGYQDTLYTHTYRQFYRWCRISGTIDFVFGDALAVFQKCDFIVRRPMKSQACMVTAQGRKDPRSQGGIIIQNSHFMATKEFLETKPAVRAYLGRPWKGYSRTVIMQSNIDGFMRPEGWSPWTGNFALDTLYYAEYQNRGLGANQSRRVKWKGIRRLNAQQAAGFRPGRLYGGDLWIKKSGIPYNA